MNWMKTLSQTYENIKQDEAFRENLVPIEHTLQTAHICITLDQKGNFKRARLLLKGEKILLPGTRDSIVSRTSSSSGVYPFAEKIRHIDKNYEKKAEKKDEKKSYYKNYEKELKKWSESKFSHPHVKSVYSYIQKGNVIKDLSKEKVLFLSKGKLKTEGWTKEETKKFKICELLTKKKLESKESNKYEIFQEEALVCWEVQSLGYPESKTWKDRRIQENWIKYRSSECSAVKSLCYVTGKKSSIAMNHPGKIRNTGDSAKIVSANDWGGLTFRGDKFTEKRKGDATKRGWYQSVNIGWETTQKAHNALAALIGRQSFSNEGQVVVAWAISSGKNPIKEDFSLNFDECSKPESTTVHARDLGESFAQSLNKAMRGYRSNLEDSEQIIIMELDAATKGRMAIAYYREFMAHDFLDRIKRWYDDFSWEIPSGRDIPYYAPALNKYLWEAVYGKQVAASLKKNIVRRILPCIVEGRSFPFDIAIGCIRRVCNRNGFKEKEEWERCLGIACSIYKGYLKRKNNERYEMSLEEDRKTRDYLYGRLLAIAEKIEEKSLSGSEKNRPTNAERYMQRFSDKPYSTWHIICKQLSPYQQNLQSRGGWRQAYGKGYKKLLDEIHDYFTGEDYAKDDPLSGEFLLGFHCQRAWLNRHTIKKGQWVLRNEQESNQEEEE